MAAPTHSGAAPSTMPTPAARVKTAQAAWLAALLASSSTTATVGRVTRAGHGPPVVKVKTAVMATAPAKSKSVCLKLSRRAMTLRSSEVRPRSANRETPEPIGEGSAGLG